MLDGGETTSECTWETDVNAPSEWQLIDRRLRGYAAKRAALDAAESFDLARADDMRMHCHDQEHPGTRRPRGDIGIDRSMRTGRRLLAAMSSCGHAVNGSISVAPPAGEGANVACDREPVDQRERGGVSASRACARATVAYAVDEASPNRGIPSEKIRASPLGHGITRRPLARCDPRIEAMAPAERCGSEPLLPAPRRRIDGDRFTSMCSFCPDHLRSPRSGSRRHGAGIRSGTRAQSPHGALAASARRLVRRVRR